MHTAVQDVQNENATKKTTTKGPQRLNGKLGMSSCYPAIMQPPMFDNNFL
jgi:hypothetical protein